ncbi:MAG: glycosyltransferase family 4 protein [Candidatus Nomurabacteria bacterium]|nr:MAG: glycosyltransferase family 4 protein [Candidatus Nomurabacteria bacterium]
MSEKRVGIDARFFGPGGKGLGRYTERLIKHLEALDLPFELVVFLREENWEEYQPSNPKVKKVLAPYRWYSLAEQLYFPRLIRAQKLDLTHYAHFNVPLFAPKRFIVTIHDLILTKFPTERASTLGPLRYWVKHAGSQLVLQQAVKRAEKVITVSQYSAEQIAQTLHVPKEKIQVILEGCEPLANTDPVRPQSLTQVEDGYVLYVGNAYPHKNLEYLLEVWEKMRASGRDETLVLVGKMDYFYSRLRERAKQKGLLEGKSPVVFAGGLSDAELQWAYAHSGLYVFPSLMEGFGLPPLEAMRAGVPVVAARASCLPEILGPAAEYFDPHSQEDLQRAMLAVLDNPALREKYISLGYEQIGRYRWEEMAKQTAQLYQELLY